MAAEDRVHHCHEQCHADRATLLHARCGETECPHRRALPEQLVVRTCKSLVGSTRRATPRAETASAGPTAQSPRPRPWSAFALRARCPFSLLSIYVGTVASHALLNPGEGQAPAARACSTHPFMSAPHSGPHLSTTCAGFRPAPARTASRMYSVPTCCMRRRASAIVRRYTVNLWPIKYRSPYDPPRGIWRLPRRR